MADGGDVWRLDNPIFFKFFFFFLSSSSSSSSSLVVVSDLEGLSMHMADILSTEWPGSLKCLATVVFLLWRASAECSASLLSKVRQISPTWDWQSVQVRRETIFFSLTYGWGNCELTCGGTGESDALFSAEDWITLFRVQLGIFMVARPYMCHMYRRWTIELQGRPNNRVFDIGTFAIHNHGDVKIAFLHLSEEWRIRKCLLRIHH